MPVDVVPEVHPCGGYQDIVTAMDVFSSYFLAYSTTNQDSDTNFEVIFNIMTKHAYLPTTIISDNRSAFLSQVIKEVADVLGITLEHATSKHSLKIGMFERTHASINKTNKLEIGERR